MKTINLTDEEIAVVIKSLEHCLETCQEGGAEKGCPDCLTVAKVLNVFKEL